MTQTLELLCATPGEQPGLAGVPGHPPPPGHTHWAAPHGPSTLANRKRAVMQQLWARDPRVSAWTGTALGVLQAANTYDHHEGIVRGADRAERNSLKTITDGYRVLAARPCRP